MTGSEIMTIKGIDCYEENGVVYLRLESCARGLGITQTKNKSGEPYEFVRWERVDAYLREFGVFPTSGERPEFIPENIFYRLAMKARNETAEGFQAFVADEVIPSIRRTGSYSKNLTPAELILVQAKALVEQERRLASVESDVHVLKAKAETRPENMYTVAGYASLKGLNLCLSKAKTLGKRATMLSNELGYVIDKTHDPRFGKVNVYHVDILKKVFREEFVW